MDWISFTFLVVVKAFCYVFTTFSYFDMRLTVRFMKLRNFFSISVMMEKSPFGRFSLTVVTFNWWRNTVSVKNTYTEQKIMRNKYA